MARTWTTSCSCERRQVTLSASSRSDAATRHDVDIRLGPGTWQRRNSPRARDDSITLRWLGNDTYGHVNNVHYYSFFNTVVTN